MNAATRDARTDALTIVDVFVALRRRATLGFLVFCCVLMIAVAVAWLMPVTYRSSVVLVPTEAMQGASDSAGPLGALGALRSLTGKPQAGVEEAVTILRSQEFTRGFIKRRGLMPILFADEWDSSAGRWKHDPKTLEDAARHFDQSVRRVNIDDESGFLTISADWRSPDLALEWARGMAEDLDREMALRAAAAAEEDLVFLTKRLEATSIPEMRQSIAGLIRDRMEAAMLAAKQRSYAFRTIDPGFASSYRYQPRRALIVAAGAIIGLLLALSVIAVVEAVSGIRSRIDRAKP